MVTTVIYKPETRTRWRQWAGMIILLILPRFDAAGQDRASAYEVYQIEAAFIYNFIDFVTWPESRQSSSKNQLTIGILGDDPFGDAFAPVEGKKVLGRTLVVRKSDRLEDLTDSWILFISKSQALNMDRITSVLKSRPILTVSDMNQFTQSGGMIQFYPTTIGGETKIRFDINKDSVDQAGLKMSFRLLSLARPKP